MVIQNEVFQAQWDDTNRHLQTPDSTLNQKIKKIAWLILSILIPPIGLVRLLGYGVAFIANKIILVGTWCTCREEDEEKQLHFNTFWKCMDVIYAMPSLGIKTPKVTMEPHTVKTPDGAELQVKLIQKRQGVVVEDVTIPTVVYFHPNAGFSEGDALPRFISGSVFTNCNFVFFNYRGVPGSTGTFAASKDLVVDGSSVVQWVRKYLQTTPENIHFYGRSLGGAIALQTKALDKELTGRLVNVCSFSSLDLVIKSMIGSCLGSLISWAIRSHGYGIDALSAYKKISGKKLIVFHSKDTLIRKKAMLHLQVEDSEKLELQVVPQHKKAMEEGGSYHNVPLPYCGNAMDRINCFLMGIELPIAVPTPIQDPTMVLGNELTA